MQFPKQGILELSVRRVRKIYRSRWCQSAPSPFNTPLVEKKPENLGIVPIIYLVPIFYTHWVRHKVPPTIPINIFTGLPKIQDPRNGTSESEVSFSRFDLGGIILNVDILRIFSLYVSHVSYQQFKSCGISV